MEGLSQLTDEKYYKKINSPIFPQVTQKINLILSHLKQKRIITNKQYEYLKVPDNPRNRKFYLLPKIHKEKSKWRNDRVPPGRPIVSDCGSDTYHLSEYIDSFLLPLATKHSSYVRDTPDFLDKIASIKAPANSFLITLDVDSLYTNIDNKDGLKTIQQIFENNPDEQRPTKQILDLLKICLENNDFTFNNEWFLQVGGTAMGKKFAPNYANLFLAKWEEDALSKCPKKPLCYLRYLDDIFIIWQHTIEEFQTFFDTLNNQHKNIKLKSTVSETSVDFLDITIFKGNKFNNSGSFDTKVYFKPTDTHELLHKSSYHPKHTFKGIIKSQVIRFHRICSNKIDFELACKTLFSVLKHRGYSSSFLRKIKRDTLHQLKPTGQSKKCGKKNCKTCPFLTETNTILNTKNKLVPLKENLDCRTEGVIYAIRCTNCDLLYVGQTSRTLHDRLTEHRSNISTNKLTTIATHFNDVCPNIEFLSIVPLEHVPRTIHDTFMGLLALEDILILLRKEQSWMRKLNTLQPNGLNKRREMPPPIPFSLTFNDQAGLIQTKVKKFYEKITMGNFGYFHLYNFVSAYKRSKNVRDILVSAE